MSFAKTSKASMAMRLTLLIGGVIFFFGSFSGRKIGGEIASPPIRAEKAAEPSTEEALKASREVRATLSEVSKSIAQGKAALEVAERKVERSQAAIAEIRENDSEYESGSIDAKQYLRRRAEITSRMLSAN